MIIVSLLVSIYYNMIIAWCLLYMFESFRKDVPWKTCDNDWNTKLCAYVLSCQSMNHSRAQHRFGGMQNESKNEGMTWVDRQIFRRELDLLTLKNGILGWGGGGWVASFTGQIKLTLVSLRGLTQIFSRASPAVLYGRNPTPGVISVSLFVRYSVCLPTCLPVCLPDSLSDYVSKHYVCIFFIVLLLSFVDKYESIHRQLSVPHWAMPPIVRVPALLKSFLSK